LEYSQHSATFAFMIRRASEYPGVSVFGSRQSGKTTLVQMTFGDRPYYSLEDPDIRQAAEADPRGFLSQLPDGGILDEIQRMPKLLPSFRA
jgi:predicted AAA+ superfamily ATPase